MGDSPKWVKSKKRRKKKEREREREKDWTMVITMAKLRMAHASTQARMAHASRLGQNVSFTLLNISVKFWVRHPIKCRLKYPPCVWCIYWQAVDNGRNRKTHFGFYFVDLFSIVDKLVFWQIMFFMIIKSRPLIYSVPEEKTYNHQSWEKCWGVPQAEYDKTERSWDFPYHASYSGLTTRVSQTGNLNPMFLFLKMKYQNVPLSVKKADIP